MTVAGFAMTCPRCQEMCPAGSTVCAECGCRLTLSVPELLHWIDARADELELTIPAEWEKR